MTTVATEAATPTGTEAPAEKTPAKKPTRKAPAKKATPAKKTATKGAGDEKRTQLRTIPTAKIDRD
ncbi:hypothetical protein AB0O04_37665, partial [Streptomyces althioticus]